MSETRNPKQPGMQWQSSSSGDDEKKSTGGDGTCDTWRSKFLRVLLNSFGYVTAMWTWCYLGTYSVGTYM